MPPLTGDDYKTMLRNLWQGRIVEKTISDLFRAGKLPNHHSGIGHESIGVGVGFGLRDSDGVQPSHRSGVTLRFTRGDLTPRDVMFAQFGKAPGGYSAEGPRYIRAVGLVGSQLPLAVGTAMADKLKGNDSVVVAFFGDGASNEGAVHEGMNLAGAWKLPIIFVIENNGFAISMPTSEATGAADFASRAAGYGMPGVTVDGNSVLGVYEVMQEAATRARDGKGPSLIEVRIVRWEGHFTGDADAYRDESIRAEARAHDGITLFRDELIGQGALMEAEAESIEREVRAEVATAVDEAEAAPAVESPASLEQLQQQVWAS
jgi:TPP-dependent pyruvate/acetoin dehydrogenase alpha subunit